MRSNNSDALFASFVKFPHLCHHRPLNPVQLDRDSQTSNDQPGCVHANMDLFKWALKLWPLLPSEQMADALELAVSCRMLVRIKLNTARRGGLYVCP